MSTFNKYFQEELSYLRELGREFSQTYPMLAPMLADRGADPDVERLLEGMAFLTGRVRQKLDDEMPEIIVAISTLLFPHLVRPLPGTTVVQMTPLAHSLRERITVPRGTEFASIDVEGTSCRFRSCADSILSPVDIADVRLEALPAGKQELRVLLDTPNDARGGDLFPPHLRLYFAGEREEALKLWMWTLEHTEDVALLRIGPDGRVLAEARLGKRALSTRAFDEDGALLPMSRATFPGFRLLEEYYVLPEKFAFVDVDAISQAASGLLSEPGQRLALSFRFDRRLLDHAPLTRESLRLHCVPVINLFGTTADPIRFSAMRERFSVRPASLGAVQGEVYAIEKVTTISRSNARRIEIPCFYDFTHVRNEAGFYYTPHYAPSVVGDGVDVSVSFGTSADSSTLPDADVASIDLLATNRKLVNSLRAGEVRLPTSTSPHGISFRNLFAVTPHVSPPFGRELHWRVVAHSTMGIRSLLELEVLRSVLDVYNLHAIADRQAARANELRIAALKQLRVKASERLYRGSPIRGVDIELDVDESGFAGDGDMYLFGAIIDRLFAHYVSLNSFSRTTLNALTSKLRFAWPPRTGSSSLI